MGWKFTFGGTRRILTDKERLAELEKDPYASIWEGGKVVDLDDLSPDAFDEIAAEDPLSGGWWTVYRFPGGSGSRLYKVACKAAEFGGAEVPSKPTNMRESLALLELCEQTEELEPIEGGFPTVRSETETTSSSGLSEDSSGSPPQPEANE
jgi:hypothetical protein